MSRIDFSRRSFIKAAGAAAGTMALGVVALAEEGAMPAGSEMGDVPPSGAEGGMSSGGPGTGAPLVGTATTPPYSGEDDVARVDENGDTVYYSMRRNWVGEAPVIDDAEIAQAIDADVVVLGLNYSGSQCFRMACEKGLVVVGVDQQARTASTPSAASSATSTPPGRRRSWASRSRRSTPWTSSTPTSCSRPAAPSPTSSASSRTATARWSTG